LDKEFEVFNPDTVGVIYLTAVLEVTLIAGGHRHRPRVGARRSLKIPENHSAKRPASDPIADYDLI
jgi:hypothetical protein